MHIKTEIVFYWFLKLMKDNITIEYTNAKVAIAQKNFNFYMRWSMKTSDVETSCINDLTEYNSTNVCIMLS